MSTATSGRPPDLTSSPEVSPSKRPRPDHGPEAKCSGETLDSDNNPPPSLGRLALHFERLELLGAFVDTTARGDADESCRSVVVPARLMARVLSMALAGEHSLTATREAVEVARLVLAQLSASATSASVPPTTAAAAAAAAKAAEAPLAGPFILSDEDGRPGGLVGKAARPFLRSGEDEKPSGLHWPERVPKALMTLERLPTALLSLVCEWLHSGAVLSGLFHTSRRLRRFVCAAGSFALSTVCLTRPAREMRFLAPDVWSRLRAVEILHEDLATAANVSAHRAHVAGLSARLRRLHLDEHISPSYADPNVAVPDAVWPGLEELVLVTGSRPTLVPAPTHLPALRCLALRVYNVPRAVDYLSAADTTASCLHSLALDIDVWDADGATALAQIAPRLESFSITTSKEVTLPPLPCVKRLAIDGYQVTPSDTDYPELAFLYVRNNYQLSAPPFSSAWSVPKLRVLDATLGGRSLPHIVAAAPLLEHLCLATTPGQTTTDVELPHILTSCKQTSLRRVEVVSHISDFYTTRFRWAPLDAQAVEAAVQAVLQLPLLEHFTCSECVDAARIDWAAVGPSLQSLLWCNRIKTPSRPLDLPQRVEWSSSWSLPFLQASRDWWVHPAADAA